MSQFFTTIWRCFTEVSVPVFGHSMTCADLVLGFFITLFSIFVIKHFLWR